MEVWEQKQFTEELIQNAAKQFQFEVSPFDLVGSHQNMVYSGVRNGERAILRITHPDHRTREQLIAEMEFISYLKERGICVAGPLPSGRDAFVEAVNSVHGDFHATAFEFASGNAAGTYQWTPKLHTYAGELTAKLHNAAQQYKPPSRARRYSWHEKPLFRKAYSFLHDEQDVLEAMERNIEQLKSLPQDTEQYGLIHGDILSINYHLDGDQLVLFDFDESAYNWFVNDIAIQFFYFSLGMTGKPDRMAVQEDAKRFFEGYRKFRSIEPYWLNQLPLFMKHREIVLYLSLKRSFPEELWGPYATAFMDGRRDRIVSEQPFLEVDFTDAYHGRPT